VKALSIRWRLALWYAAAMAFVLVVFCMILLMLTRQQLLSRVDSALREESRELALELQLAPNRESVNEHLRLRFFRHDIYEFLVADDHGHLLFSSQGASQPHAEALAKVTRADSSEYLSVKVGEEPIIRAMRQDIDGPIGKVTVLTFTSLAPVDADLRALLWLISALLPLAVMFALAGGYFLATRALAPVQEIVRIADSINISNLNRRIEVPNRHDELGQLAGTLNSLIARLEQAVEEIQRFTADASHELRTPLAVLRAEAESALRKPRTSEEYQQSLTTVVEEATRLGRLADQLLNLSRHDAGLTNLRRERLSVDALLLDIVEQLRPLAATRSITLNIGSMKSFELVGDDLLLRQAIFNLADNAIKYTRKHGEVTVECEADTVGAQIRVIDTGIGIPHEHLPRVFERFYRVDPSRNTDIGGAGLGLAITRATVQLHGGSIEIDSKVNVGTTVTIRLPGASRLASVTQVPAYQ
jgi:heavy metal sensor kinase